MGNLSTVCIVMTLKLNMIINLLKYYVQSFEDHRKSMNEEDESVPLLWIVHTIIFKIGNLVSLSPGDCLTVNVHLNPMFDNRQKEGSRPCVLRGVGADTCWLLVQKNVTNRIQISLSFRNRLSYEEQYILAGIRGNGEHWCAPQSQWKRLPCS